MGRGLRWWVLWMDMLQMFFFVLFLCSMIPLLVVLFVPRIPSRPLMRPCHVFLLVFCMLLLDVYEGPGQSGSALRGKDFVGNQCWVFTSPDDPDLHLDEMQLKAYRRLSFDPVFENTESCWKYKWTLRFPVSRASMLWKH